LTRRSVQSYLEIGFLPLEDSGSSIATNHTFHRFAPRGSVAAMKKAGWGAALVAVILLAVAVIVEAQQPAKVSRIGYFSNTDPATDSARAEEIRLALRDLGYIEGQNIAIEYRYAEGRPDRAREHLAELVRLKVDIIVVASGDPWIRAAKNATKTIPIVMMGQGSDPVRAGFVESLGRPGGNVTGITNLTRDLGGKRLELLKEAVPKLARVAVLYDPANQPSLHEVKELLPADARALKLTIEPWEIRAVDDFEKVFAALNKQRLDGLYSLGAGRVMRPNQKRIVGFALKSQLPSIYTRREHVEAGGLMSYRADEADSYRRVATYIDKILRGAKPADLPVEQPTKFELVINLKTAKQIGLAIPPGVLALATKLIK
jgi:putative ABC transport system substrate-binding protein